eukprot:6492415-Amphidinium_carterae.1
MKKKTVPFFPKNSFSEALASTTVAMAMKRRMSHKQTAPADDDSVPEVPEIPASSVKTEAGGQQVLEEQTQPKDNRKRDYKRKPSEEGDESGEDTRPKKLTKPAAEGYDKTDMVAFNRFKLTKVGMATLSVFVNDAQIRDFRKEWMLNRAASKNSVTRSSKRVLEEKEACEGGWFTAHQIKSEENLSEEELPLVLAGLASRPCQRFPWLAENPLFTEYNFKRVALKTRSATASSAMEVTSVADVDVPTGEALDGGLGVASDFQVAATDSTPTL